MPRNLHIENARIWTGNPGQPSAGSLTIIDGRVSTLDAPAPDVMSIDAEGRTLTPGLIDAHMHLLMGGQSLSELDLSGARSRDEFERLVAAHRSTLPAGRWLIARGWSSENWAGGELPTSAWLASTGNRPAVCWRMDHHAVLVNDTVLEMCNLPQEISGGRVVRNPSTHRPTGLLIEAAAWQLIRPLVPDSTWLDRRHALRAAQDHAHRFGLTSVGTMEYARDVAEVFDPLREDLTLRCRFTLLDRPLAEEPFDDLFATSFVNDERLTVIGFKTFIDGTLGSRTARMLADYADDPGNRGMLVEPMVAGQLREWVRAVASAGWSPSMHAIGDEAARLALDAIEGIEPATRPRLEHVQQIDPADLPRFAGVIASMQPLHKADDCRYVLRRLGQERLAGTFAFRSLLDAGARLAFGSDWPIVSCDPVAGMRAAITGLTLDGEVFAPDQNLTVEESLLAYTQGAAHCLGMGDVGRLTPGAFGDLVLYDRDPFTADWTISPPRILLTVAGGRMVFDGR